MQRELLVYIDLNGQPELVGKLWARERAGRESSSFAYDETWLKRQGAFALSPSLMLTPGQFHTAKGLPNALTDSAPDSWGRKLMARRERARAKKAKTQPRTLFDIDYLAGVDDQTRLGAIRFKDVGGDAFLTVTNAPVPPLIDLPKLLSATARIERDEETDEDLLLVLAPGTSLGGARPKATVRDANGRLLIAKFPKRDDDWPVTLWEAVLLELAARAGIDVPEWRLETIAKKPVVLIRRFDRSEDGQRIAFMSAMTAIDATDHGEQRSYLELADIIRQIGSAPERDLEELWRRIVFNVLVSNTDDHLRNHAFLHDGSGWRLSPVYDLNPCPVDVKPRVHALAIDEGDATASIDTALSVAKQFGLKPQRAKAIAAEVGAAVSEWRGVAKSQGLTPAQIERMSSAFDHDDAKTVAGFKKAEPVKAEKPKQKAPAKKAAKPKAKSKSKPSKRKRR
ncbi:type II toxin-antitoxin system HipA family toxin [Hyphomicrobium sp.]|uniref:type II toxin-antitoxin system HipA family toxin n=1 Tax=Hyphomicrobium sp. TaxID=82 RepID=UPI002C106424|nr:type II toxin-antitoxin system HipA family toxin [Hyphomicrobium sp.]HRN89895.1 type II toxin-antitoxin system HipA family toxin [Hyphomicrobium sp.]HRQ28314.1 type II toxin-antitoxin system HipA family toxin [Hyphomicrobium sp.]